MSGKIKKGKGKGKFNFFFSLMKRSKNHTRSVFYEKTVHAHGAIYEKTAKNLILRLKSFNSALISMVDYSEARLITLLLIGKGVRFILFTMAVGRIIDNVAFIQERPNSHSIEFVTCSESYPERFSRRTQCV